MLALACSCRVAPSPPGWSFFFVRDLDVLSSWAQQHSLRRSDFYLSALASAYDSRARHFAVLHSTALACSLGCGPSSVLRRQLRSFLVFSFRRKTTKILFLRTFSRKRRRHGMAARLRNNCLVAPTGLCLCSCAVSPAVGKGLGKTWKSVDLLVSRSRRRFRNRCNRHDKRE